MRKTSVFLVLPALLVSIFIRPAPASSQGDGTLVASPSVGHSGDTIDVSGTGLPSHKHLFIMMACPDWLNHTAFQYGNIKIQQDGPTTDGHGQFTRFPFRVLTLQHFPQLACQIYTSDGLTSYGPTYPATFYILPRGQAPRSCDTRICLRVKATPARVRSGLAEHIRLQSYPHPWPGAKAVVTVSYPGAKPSSHTVTLNMRGFGQLVLPVTTQSAQTVGARVRVRTQLGTHAGSGTGQFTIVR
jgi:hypothetical protein